MKYVIDIRDFHHTGERVCGELETEEKLEKDELLKAITDFAEENGICPSYALEHCFVNDVVQSSVN